MTPELERAREIFLYAVGRVPADQWDAYVDQACGADAGLAGRVRHLLRAHAEAGSFLEAPAGGPGATAAYAPGRPAAGSLVGPYKLLQKLGEGGMGEVWMAEQTEPVQRKVALKLIRPGMDSKQVVARFEAERQALALMDHPHIARVFDGGATADGRPFFVMELVKGIPITRYGDEHRLTPRERLELFAQACLAVQHAHQKGLIHRDIKPSNVLVAPYDGRPVVKVIDFGVAKATGHRLTDKTLFTEFGAVIGTLEYMSPEQAELNNQDIDIRSDIYSLGVLLYELLTGSTPVTRDRLKEVAFAEVLRVIREEEPPRPSTRLSTTDELPSIAANRGLEPKKLSGLVRGELDWIVMKALEKDRSRRYETANGLAADVQHYLADEPVLACPPSAAYRLRKLARRNRRRLAVAAALALAVLVGTGAVGWAVRDRAARQQEVERDRLDRRERAAARVNLILADVDRLQGERKWPEALALARRAEAALTDAEADAETQDRVRDRLTGLEFVARLDRIRQDQAARLMREAVRGSYRRFADEYARAFRDFGTDVEHLTGPEAVARLRTRPAIAGPLAAALDEWNVARQVGFGAPDPLAEKVLGVAREIDPDPLRRRVHDCLARALPPEPRARELRQLAGSVDARTASPEGLILLARALAHAGASDVAAQVLRDGRTARPDDFWLTIELAGLLRRRQDTDAGRYFTAAVALRPDSVWAQYCLAGWLDRFKSPAAAAAGYRRTLDLDPNFDLGHYGLGTVLRRLNQPDAAEASFRRAIAANPAGVMAHYGLGELLLDRKRPAEAVPHLRVAIPHSTAVDYPYAHEYLARALEEEGKLPEAIDARRAAVRQNPTPVSLRALAMTYGTAGQWDKAAAEYDRAVELDPADAHGRYMAAVAHAGAGQLDDYRRACRAMVARYAETNSPIDAERTVSACLLVPGTLDAADLDQVQRLAERAVTGTERDRSFRSYARAKGLADFRAGRPADAVRWLDRYAADGTGLHQDAIAYAILAMAQHRRGKVGEARAALAQAREILTTKRPDPKTDRPFMPGQSHGWLYADLLYREAEALVRKKDQP